MKALHILPRFMGGGPERHLLALIAAWRRAGHRSEHTVAVLDAPVSAPLLIQARRLGIRMLVKPDRQALHAAIDNADLVEITYWNHPRLLELLRQELPLAACSRVCRRRQRAAARALLRTRGVRGRDGDDEPCES